MYEKFKTNQTKYEGKKSMDGYLVGMEAGLIYWDFVTASYTTDAIANLQKALHFNLHLTD